MNMMELCKKFLLFASIYSISILDFAISLEKFYSVFSQQNSWELVVKKSIFRKNWTPSQACCEDFNLKIIYLLLVKSVFTVWRIDIKSRIRNLLKLKFPLDEQLHNSFWMILLIFYETFQYLLEVEEGRFCRTLQRLLQHTFPLFYFFSMFTVKLKRGPQHCARVKIFHFGIIRRPKIHFRSTLNSAYKKCI